jgi:hypothetical protein
MLSYKQRKTGGADEQETPIQHLIKISSAVLELLRTDSYTAIAKLTAISVFLQLRYERAYNL